MDVIELDEGRISMTESSMNEHFVGLLMQLHYTAWVQLGKVANPATGKVDRNLEAAKGTIDVLGSLEEKTKGNLNDEEEKLLSSADAFLKDWAAHGGHNDLAKHLRRLREGT